MVVGLLRDFSRLCLYLACGLVTVFILSSSYETAFGQDLPYVKAVNKVDLSFIQPNVASASSVIQKQTEQSTEGNYGTPNQLKMSGSQVRVSIAQPISRGNNWLARASTAHYVALSPAKNGNLGDTIIYMQESKTTVQDANQVEREKNIFLDTNRGWRYLYRVNEVVTIGVGQSYVLPKSNSSHLYIVVQSQLQERTVIAASLINVQSAEQ